MKKIIFITVLLFITTSYGQKQLINEQFNFSIQEPKDWIKADKNEGLTNLKNNIKLSEEKINELIENNKGTVEVVTFYKYPVNSVNGVIPTIKVNLRKNPAKAIDDFKRMMDNSIVNVKATFPKFKITVEPKILKVDGKDCVYFESINIIPTRKGDEEVRTLTYAVPVGNNFYQINFMDTKKDNCDEIFNDTLNSIHL